MTEAEITGMLEALRGANDTASFRRVIDDVRTLVAEKQKNIQAGATPEAVQEYQKRGGTIVDVKRDKRQAPYVQEPK